MLLKKAEPPLPSGSFRLEVPAGADAASVIDALGIPRDLVGSVTVNKRRSPKNRVLEAGDSVAIIPAISGG